MKNPWNTENERTWQAKIWLGVIAFPFPFEFSQFCQMVEAKIAIRLSDVALKYV